MTKFRLAYLLLLIPQIAFLHSLNYSETNQGRVSFDVSMPIDATGFTLHGKNLTGGTIQFKSEGMFVTPLLADETGSFELPIVTSLQEKPMIKTHIQYHAIKFINPVGINNFFIKIGTATRSQIVTNLDPKVLHDGTYDWTVPIFAVGRENNTVDHTSHHFQFMQVGATGGPSTSNAMYTQEFYLFTEAQGNSPIAESSQVGTVLPNTNPNHFTCYAEGIWGSKSDPYRKIVGQCIGQSTVFPAGPNLDYEYGTIKLPTIETPWNGTEKDQCFIEGKRHSGCVNATIDSTLHYMAQKIRVPIGHGITLFAESGSAYRSIIPNNLRYEKNNVYLKNLIKPEEYSKKSYLPGGFMTPYFAVGFEFEKKRVHYSAQYHYTNESENANRIAWRDASSTQIYSISVSNKKISQAEIQENFHEALKVIEKLPEINKVLSKTFFVKIFKNNNVFR